MIDVILKVKNNSVKVLNSENRIVDHVFEVQQNDVNSVLLQLNKEVKEFDLSNYNVLEIEY